MDRIKALESASDEINSLYLLLKQLKDTLGDRFATGFNRSLPFSELLFDRWERAGKLGFGTGTSIYDSAYVFGDVRVGANTWIGPYTILDGSGGLTIGSNCSISAGVQIYTHDSVRWAITGGKEAYEYGPTIIEDNCYIGPNTIISKGVTIGSNTVIGANSFVNRSFLANSKIAGSPAKEI